MPTTRSPRLTRDSLEGTPGAACQTAQKDASVSWSWYMIVLPHHTGQEDRSLRSTGAASRFPLGADGRSRLRYQRHDSAFGLTIIARTYCSDCMRATATLGAAEFASTSARQIAMVVIVSNNLPRLPMHAGKPAQLRDLGYDEIWLQNWLATDPARLGLGEIQIVAQELSAPRGGSLDILARDGDTYYSVEVQLGEVDASHSFRVFDYWARNRMRFKDKTHVAALMVGSATGRYRPALDALAEYLPLVVIELRAWRGEAEVILVPEAVVINENLDVAGPAGTVAGAERSEADRQATISGEAWAFYKAFVAWTEASLGEVRVDLQSQVLYRHPPRPPGVGTVVAPEGWRLRLPARSRRVARRAAVAGHGCVPGTTP